jgi:hypothetical protein
MFFALLAQIISFLLTVVALPCRSNREKDLEILLLRHQLALLQRNQTRPVRPTRWLPSSPGSASAPALG